MDEKREDPLKTYLEQSQLSTDRFISILKEIASQFNSIANQLLLTAKGIESLNTTFRDISSGLKENIQLQLQQLYKDIYHNCSDCLKTITACIQDIQTLPSTIREEGDHIVKEIKDLGEKIQEINIKIEDHEKNSLNRNTLYTVIIGAIVAAATVLGLIIQNPMCNFSSHTSNSKKIYEKK